MKKKARNPWAAILENTKSIQKFNAWHQTKGVNRVVKEITLTEIDVMKIYERQNGLSVYLKLPIDPMDVFRKNYPMSPSLDRIDNSKGYTFENVCLSTRFENLGFNKCDQKTRDECIAIIKSKQIHPHLLGLPYA